MNRSWDQYAHRLCAGYEYRLSFSTMDRFSLRSYRGSVPHENGVICIFIELLHLMPISLDLWTVWYLNSSGASQPPVWVTCKYNKNNAACDLVNHIYTMTGFGPTRSGERLPVGGRKKKKKRVEGSYLLLTRHDKNRKINLTNGLWCKYQPLEMEIDVEQRSAPQSLRPLLTFSDCERVNCHFFQASPHA